MTTTTIVDWTPQRKIAGIMHLIFIVGPLSVSTVAAWVWWSRILDSGWFAAGLILTLEILGIVSLTLHILRIQWPLAWIRHIIPFFSVGPLGYEVLQRVLATDRSLGLGASILTVAIVSWLVFLEFQLLRSFERLFIDPVTAAEEAARQNVSQLQTLLASYRVRTEAFQEFAASVPARRTIEAQPLQMNTDAGMWHLLEVNQPLLETTGPMHSKMKLIVNYARKQGAGEGGWMYTIDEIQRLTKVQHSTVDVITRLVRSGQLSVLENDNEYR